MVDMRKNCLVIIFTMFSIYINAMGQDSYSNSSAMPCKGAARLTNSEYKKSLDLILSLREVKKIASNADAQIHFGGEDVDGPQFFNGECYWSITVYRQSNMETHRWKTYLVNPHKKKILTFDDVAGGVNPRPLKN